MITTMRKSFYFTLCFILTLFAFQCLPLITPNQIVSAEENTASQKVKSPSFTVKGANITPVKQESGEKQPGTSTTGDQPHLAIDPSSHDVGEIWEGDDIIHSFIVKNTGKALLNIKNVKAG